VGSPQGCERGDRAAPAGVDRGVTFIEIADSYGPGVSETLIAKALHPYPAELVVATKGGLTRPGADRWVADWRADHPRRAYADSLRRLRLERIELYQLHAVDHRVPIEDSIGALVDLQKEGKIHHIGVSNVSQRELARAGAVATIVSVQNCYNLRDRSSDRLIDICAGAGIAFILGIRWLRAGSLPALAARSDRPEPRRHAQANCARLAAASFSRHAANPRDLLDGTSRRESRLCIDPLERRRVRSACFSLAGSAFAGLPRRCEEITRELTVAGCSIGSGRIQASIVGARHRMVVCGS
jgi:aryl-alcohol dehydrogenase-like predicted oxidoreductase